MQSPLVLIAKHTLGVDKAKRQVSDRFEVSKPTLERVGEASMTWSEYTAQVSPTALGQRA